MIHQVTLLHRLGHLRPDHVGVFGITGDPVHWGHLATMLDAIRNLRLGKVYLVGAAGRSKSSLQISVAQRFGMFQRAAELFHPLIEFVPVDGDPPAESVALDLWSRLSFPKVAGYYLYGEEYLDNPPRLLQRLLQERPNDALDLHMVISRRAQTPAALQEAIDERWGGSSVAFHVLESVAGLSSTRFREDPRTPIVPHALRQLTWDEGIYGPRATIAMDGVLQSVPAAERAVMQPLLREVGLYLLHRDELGLTPAYLFNRLLTISREQGAGRHQRPGLLRPDSESSLTIAFPHQGRIGRFERCDTPEGWRSTWFKPA